MAGMDEDFTAGAVHVPVMGFAQEYAILYACFAIIDPVQAMMRLAHSR